METIIQDWLNENDQIEIISTSQSQHLRENTVFVTVFYRLKLPSIIAFLHFIK
ncbi:MAG: hypothetical protein CM15mP64_7350 [Candidatus Neomarinimicrobiota bacterium]|nr:MAG: hypothetical protein CM15mP64_7350 [Candidatus Neomarinimicrobiota bacterium]